MLHQFEIGAVVARDVLDAVGELLAWANSCLRLLKQQAIGSRRASMILALGSIRWIRPMCRKLFGILSMKNGLPVR